MRSQETPMLMAEVTKDDCMTIDAAVAALKYTRATLYSYMNLLSVQRYRFPFDRHTFILKSEVERIKQFIATNKG